MENDRESIEQILQACLELLFSGNETVDTLLARYPDVANELRPDLEAAELLRSWKKDLAPRPGFVSASRHRVMARIQEDAPAGVPLLQMLRDPLFWEYWLNKNIVRLAVVGGFVLVLLINFGYLANRSQQALPGDNLYPLKRTLEKVELAVALDDTQDAALNLEFTERRLDELQFLIDAKAYEELTESVEDFESQVNQTMQSLGTVADDDVDAALDIAYSLNNILGEADGLDSMAEQAPSNARRYLEEAAKVSESAKKQTEVIISTLEPVAETPVVSPTRTPAHSSQQEVTPTSAPTRTSPPTRTPRPAPATPTSAPIENEPVFPVVTRSGPVIPTALPTVAITPLPSNTSIPYSTPEPTDTPVPTATNTPRPTSTNTPQPTDTQEPTETNTPRPTSTNTSEPTNTPEPTETNTPRPTATDTPEPTDTPPATEALPEIVPTLTPGRTSTPTPDPGSSDLIAPGGASHP